MVQGISINNKSCLFFLQKLNLLYFSVQILGLDADTNYNIEIYAEQISTHLLSKSVDLSFTTKRPSKNLIFFEKKEKRFSFYLSSKINS